MHRKTQASMFIQAPPDVVFTRVSDHEKTESWVPKVKKVMLLKEGTPRNGMPAVRRVEFRPFGWSTIDEKITAYDAEARAFSYSIIAGMPGIRDHLGTFTVIPEKNGCIITWSVRFDFNPWLWGLFADLFVKTFSKAMDEGLQELSSQYVTNLP